MTKPIRVLFDGWALAHRPNSPAAVHLLALLALCPPAIKPRVAVPGPAHFRLSEGVETAQLDYPATGGGRLVWEQRALSRLARAYRADVLHLFSSGPALFSTTPSLASPAGFERLWEPGADAGMFARPAGGAGRLASAFGRGGLARLKALFWPADLPNPPRGSGPVAHLPPVVQPSFLSRPAQALTPLPGDLPEVFLLYHGSNSLPVLRRLLAAWTWAAGPVGEAYPLVLLGLDNEAQARIAPLLAEYEVGSSVRLLEPVNPESLPALYHRCAALVHLGPVSPWGGPIEHALACGKPVAAVNTPQIDARVGPAGYLAPADDLRTLGAAMITVVVEESVSEKLSVAARERAAGWDAAAFSARLLAEYQKIA